MALVQVKDAEGPVLDWMVAKCEGKVVNDAYRAYQGLIKGMWGAIRYKPSSDWSQGGPIIEELRSESNHSFLIENDGDEIYVLAGPSAHVMFKGRGETLLVAIMRCYVSYKLGDTVEVPDELIERRNTCK